MAQQDMISFFHQCNTLRRAIEECHAHVYARMGALEYQLGGTPRSCGEATDHSTESLLQRFVGPGSAISIGMVNVPPHASLPIRAACVGALRSAANAWQAAVALSHAQRCCFPLSLGPILQSGNELCPSFQPTQLYLCGMTLCHQCVQLFARPVLHLSALALKPDNGSVDLTAAPWGSRSFRSLRFDDSFESEGSIQISTSSRSKEEEVEQVTFLDDLLHSILLRLANVFPCLAASPLLLLIWWRFLRTRNAQQFHREVVACEQHLSSAFNLDMRLVSAALPDFLVMKALAILAINSSGKGSVEKETALASFQEAFDASDDAVTFSKLLQDNRRAWISARGVRCLALALAVRAEAARLLANKCSAPTAGELRSKSAQDAKDAIKADDSMKIVTSEAFSATSRSLGYWHNAVVDCSSALFPGSHAEWKTAALYGEDWILEKEESAEASNEEQQEAITPFARLYSSTCNTPAAENECSNRRLDGHGRIEVVLFRLASLFALESTDDFALAVNSTTSLLIQKSDRVNESPTLAKTLQHTHRGSFLAPEGVLGKCSSPSLNFADALCGGDDPAHLPLVDSLTEVMRDAFSENTLRLFSSTGSYFSSFIQRLEQRRKKREQDAKIGQALLRTHSAPTIKQKPTTEPTTVKTPRKLSSPRGPLTPRSKNFSTPATAPSTPVKKPTPSFVCAVDSTATPAAATAKSSAAPCTPAFSSTLKFSSCTATTTKTRPAAEGGEVPTKPNKEPAGVPPPRPSSSTTFSGSFTKKKKAASGLKTTSFVVQNLNNGISAAAAIILLAASVHAKNREATEAKQKRQKRMQEEDSRKSKDDQNWEPTAEFLASVTAPRFPYKPPLRRYASSPVTPNVSSRIRFVATPTSAAPTLPLGAMIRRANSAMSGGVRKQAARSSSQISHIEDCDEADDDGDGEDGIEEFVRTHPKQQSRRHKGQYRPQSAPLRPHTNSSSREAISHLKISSTIQAAPTTCVPSGLPPRPNTPAVRPVSAASARACSHQVPPPPARTQSSGPSGKTRSSASFYDDIVWSDDDVDVSGEIEALFGPDGGEASNRCKS